MQSCEHAIVVSPTGAAWKWRLIDADGDAVASGEAETQEAAMTRAWSAAKLDGTATRRFPELTVAHAPRC